MEEKQLEDFLPDKKTSYINAEKLVDDTLLNISISQFDENFNLAIF